MKMPYEMTLKGLYAQRYRLSACAFLAVSLTWMGGNPFLMAMLSAVLVTGGYVLHLSYLNTFKDRMNDPHSPVWEVKINEVTVGKISDAEYAGIQYQCMKSSRLYIDQAMNIVSVLSKSFDQIGIIIPISLFWILVICSAISPGTIANILNETHHINAQDVQQVVEQMLGMAAMLMFIGVFISWTFGIQKFGFKNRFDEAIGIEVRKRCKTPADGQIVLTMQNDGVWHVKNIC